MAAQPVIKKAFVLAFSAILSIAGKAQLTANFSATPLAGCPPLVVNFTDLSTGNPNQWQWDLGNGTNSVLQNPSVTYFNPGTYTIKLVIHNAAGNADSIVKTQYITVNTLPTVNFSATPLSGCYPLPVQFTDLSTPGSGSIDQWTWDFGDGFISTSQNPSHIYTSAGNYNVTLQIRNSEGCTKILTKPAYIQISSGVTANFTNNNPSACSPPVTINFTNLSTGTGALNYQWSFGDGGTSTLTNPTHTYSAAGSYTVTLVVTNNLGCTDTITKVNVIVVGTASAGFTNTNNVCVNSPVIFTNTSVPVPASVTWDFGDGTGSAILNPTKSYSAPGIYVVKMVADFGGCLDSAFGTVNVQAKPVVNFTGSPLSICQPPLTVNFSNLTPGVSFNWNFGDGNTSTIPNPSHTYTSYGSFDVTLSVTNAAGCTDSLKRVAYITIQPPQASINNLPRMGCAPITHTFSSTVTSVDPVVSYWWDFGDGNTSSLPNPTHTFAAGSYTITLIITTAGGCTDTVVVPNGIVASTKPVANFTATPRDVCAHIPVQFNDLTIGGATQWLWTFGDGSTSTDQNPIHVYEDTGYFNITLVVWNNGCPDTITFIDYIHINPPIANFVVSNDCTNRMYKTFTDQSIGADEWNWDFGDGATSTLQNPAHTYAATGTYIVTLRVKNYTTGCEYTKTMPIQVIIEMANFTANDSIICRNTQVLFVATGNNPSNIAAYNWDYGDGNGGAGQNQYHLYTVSGIYNVTLIATDVLGCRDTLTKPLYIHVNGPTAAFTPNVSTGCSQNAIVFTDNSIDDGTHPITQWIWNWGDGNIDTLSSPPFSHAYTSAGSFTVSLKVSDNNGCSDSLTQATGLVISKPIAGFTSPDTLVCPNQTVHFTNTSSGNSLLYTWNFGDGSTSTLQDPIHSYTTDGSYNITLIATDANGCSDTLIKPLYINIATPHANFTMSDSVTTCPPLLVTFTNTSINAASSTWDFGDGTSTPAANPTHFYTLPGTYLVKLMITGPGICTDTIIKPIIIRGPRGTFTYGPFAGCKPLTINFNAHTQDSLSFIWDYNDGTLFTTNDSAVSHTYTSFGNFVPKLILVDTSGCQFPVLGPDTIKVRGADALFSFTNQNFCDFGTMQFTDSSSSNDLITNYNWNFGDGSTSTLQNPSHFYSTPGLYYPQLVVTTQLGCRDTLISPAPVRIVASPQASITNTPNGCAPLTVTFNGSLLIADTSAINWQWDFGNGNSSSLQNPPAQIYTNPTTYTIQLIATNSTGCKDTVTKTVDAYLVPTINAGVDTMICKNRGITLNATGASNYTWTPANGLSCTNCASPVATPDSITNYIVTGSTVQGCSNTDTVQVKVNYPFAMNNSQGDTICAGKSVRLYANGADRYVWSPSTGLNSTTSATPLATPTSSTTYMVVGYDNVGCFTDTGYVQVKVYPIPTVDAGPDKTINVGQAVDLTPTISPDVTDVIWTPTGSIFRNNFPGITVKPKETTEYTVEVRNQGGCKTRDKVTIFVVCNGANVFIPNTFSPNGDGANDIFYPRGNGLFSIKTLRIFNRWGEIVFENNKFMPNDASAGWNGTFKGQKLTPDVYVYTIDIICDNSTIMTFKGNVALIQ